MDIHPLVREAVTVFMVEGDEGYGDWLAALSPEESDEYQAAIEQLADDPNGAEAVDEFIVALALAHPYLAQMRARLGQYSSGGGLEIETETLAAAIIDRIPNPGPLALAPWSGRMKNGREVPQNIFMVVGVRDGEPATVGYFHIPVDLERRPGNMFSMVSAN